MELISWLACLLGYINSYGMKKRTKIIWHLQVKILNKLASARAAGEGSGSKVLTDLVEGLEEPKVALELRLKIDKNHSDLEGRYMILDDFHFSSWLGFLFVCCISLSTEDCRDFREYGEMVLQQVSNSIETNPNLKKASVNYEGVSCC